MWKVRVKASQVNLDQTSYPYRPAVPVMSWFVPVLLNINKLCLFVCLSVCLFNVCLFVCLGNVSVCTAAVMAMRAAAEYSQVQLGVFSLFQCFASTQTQLNLLLLLLLLLLHSRKMFEYMTKSI